MQVMTGLASQGAIIQPDEPAALWTDLIHNPPHLTLLTLP